MKTSPSRVALLFTALASAALITACGGGDDVSTRSVKVVGDSLSDGGTFGVKAMRARGWL